MLIFKFDVYFDYFKYGYIGHMSQNIQVGKVLKRGQYLRIHRYNATVNQIIQMGKELKWALLS